MRLLTDFSRCLRSFEMEVIACFLSCARSFFRSAATCECDKKRGKAGQM